MNFRSVGRLAIEKGSLRRKELAMGMVALTEANG